MRPAPAPVPALKYALLPEVRDLKPGNAVLLYQRAHSFEWWGFRRQPDYVKLFDYLALGLPVVGRRTTPLMRFGDVIVHAGTVSEYVPAMEQARQLRQQASFRRRAQELARRNSWSDRIGALEGFLRKELVGKPLRDLPTT